METDVILKGNRALAEFMGFPFFFGEPYNDDVEEWELPGGVVVETGELAFHSSWDCIMPVMEKIELLGFWTKIGGHTTFDNKWKTCSIKKYKPKSDGDYIYSYDGEWNISKIEAVWSACVEFAEWYKKQSK